MAIALAADAKGSCVDTTAPCDVNTKYLLKTTSTVAAGTMLTFCDQGGSGKFKCGVCTAKATDGTATLCATLAFTSTDYSFAADPADRCLTCTTTATYNIKAGDAATTNQYGTCTAITTACGTTFPKIQSGASAVIYYCAALVDLETTFYKKCTTVSQTIASHIYATINAYQIDCTTCAATGESLVITLVADTKGYCALTTNPCDVNTKYLAKTTSTVAAGAMLTYCDQGTGGKFRCAVCTAKSTVRCATFKFSATDYSFDAEPASRCATCTTAADIMLLAGSTDYYGECLASSTDFSTKCLTNGYR